MPDYLKLARDLRAKAEYVPPPGSGLAPVGPEEKAALLAKAKELEVKYGNFNSPFTDDTIVTSRDGRWSTVDIERIRRERAERAWKIANDLLRSQFLWNSEYYYPDGTPKPQEPAEPDPPKEDEDYGYETFTEKSEYYDE